MRKLLSIGLFALLFAGTVSAKDFKLFLVTNDMDNDSYEFILKADSNDVANGLKMKDRKKGDITNFAMGNLRSGVVLRKEGSHKVIIVKSNDFEFDRGGHLKVDYLYNGITGSRKSLDLKVDYNGSTWTVYSRGSKVNRLHFKGKKVFGKIVGIKEVQVK